MIAAACPQARVWGTDVNPKALALTAVNARLAGVDNLHAQASDVLGNVSGEFDLIVANPPYMQDPKGRAYRDGGSGLGSGLSLRILAEALERLAPGGTLLLYTGVAIVNGQDPFLAGARQHLEGFAGGWRYQELDPDVFGEDLALPGYVEAERIAVVLLEARRQP
jgi:23S rRNA G2069 N7-methylase RlmK/C1962 C5-methylase RlmI